MFSSLVKPYQPTPDDSASPVVLDVSFERIKAKRPEQPASLAEETVDLNRLAVKNPVSTYFLRGLDTSMTGAGIYPNDILIVDKGLKAKERDIVVAAIDGNFTVRTLSYEDGLPVLRPEHPDYEPIRLGSFQELVLFGVVRGVYRDIK